MAETTAVRFAVERTRLPELLTEAARSARVFVPHRVDREVDFAEFSPETEIVLDYRQTRLSPKSVFFPQTETIFTFEADSVESIPVAEEPIVLFGVRPCDAHALTLLDQVFGRENHGIGDPYYEARRRKSVVISLVCETPCSTCFCTSVGGGPANTRGADVMAYDLGDSFYFEATTDKGVELLDVWASKLSPASDGQAKAAEEIRSVAREAISEFPYDAKTVQERLDESFEDPVWIRLTNTCIGCGVCTYLCPTCHCFDISDEARHYRGRRIRTWDSCQYPLFTKHASGHNPRPSKIARLRQRFMHKFSYTVQSLDETYCVGCGRCVRYCPVNLDIRKVIQEFSTP